MIHNSGMQPFRRRTWLLLMGMAITGSPGWAQTAQSAHGGARIDPHWHLAVSQASREAPDALMLVLDIGSGNLLASAHLAEASRRLATPGSTLKPLILYFALASGHWDPKRRVACSRQMRIGGHQLNCSHPAGRPDECAAGVDMVVQLVFCGVSGIAFAARNCARRSASGACWLPLDCCRNRKRWPIFTNRAHGSRSNLPHWAWKGFA